MHLPFQCGHFTAHHEPLGQPPDTQLAAFHPPLELQDHQPRPPKGRMILGLSLMTIRSVLKLVTVTGLLTLINSCSPSNSASLPPAIEDDTAAQNSESVITAAETTLWTGEWLNPDWMDNWGVRNGKSWGFENLEIIAESQERFETILRVHYPAGSASPSVSRQDGIPLGGAQFYADLSLPPYTELRLSYYIRFSENFDFVKGGKLPGLFGGEGASGGTIPDGTDGFSTRLMWRRNGDGEVYAYLPTSEKHGTSIERGAWRFEPGVWYHIEQEVRLNHPSRADGQIRLWINEDLVIDKEDLLFRTAETLQIDGLFFSTFFGGGDASWATPRDVYADFADLSVTAVE